MSSPFESRLKHGRADVNRKAPDDKVSSLVPQPRQFQRDTMLTERAVVGFKEQSVESHADFELIRTWLTKCKADDTAPAPSPRLPSRVLNVGSLGSQTVKLMQTGPEDTGSYVALSFCWGTGTIPKTTVRNLQQHLKGILVESLPQTYQDAIVLTQKLQIQYLWIDALCIIQDSQQDRQAEVAGMAEIYKNAQVALCALAASESESELDSRWSTRAWVDQEHLLSPSVIYFDDSEMCLERNPGPQESSILILEHVLQSKTNSAYDAPDLHRTCPIDLNLQQGQVGDDFADQVTLRNPSSIGLSSSRTLAVDRPVSYRWKSDLPDDPEDFELADDRSHVTTSDEKEAKDHIAYFLATHPVLSALCNLLLSNMDETCLINNTEQVLGVLYEGLLGDASTELEQISVNLLKSARGRARIGRTMLRIINAHKTIDEEERLRFLEQHELMKARLESFIADRPHGTAEELRWERVLDADDKLQDTDAQSDEGEEGIAPNVAAMETFFGSSKAFEVFLNSFRLLLLPERLRSLLQSASTDTLCISREDDHSLENILKGTIEGYTQVDWDWWPLQPRMRPLTSSESRLCWRCSCGTKRWEHISLQEAELIQQMLPGLQHASAGPASCISSWQQRSTLVRLAGNIIYSLSGVFGKQQAPVSSASGPANSVTNQASGLGSAPARGNSLTLPPNQNLTSVSHPSTNTSASGAVLLERWILFGVQGSRFSLEVEHIAIDDYINDSSFFRSLRHHYRQHRGRLKMWLSIWRLGFCDGVKFDRLAPNFVLGDNKDLPTDYVEYKYEPKPPTAQNPLIDRHQASIFLNCDSPCRWRLFHECAPELMNRKAIERIPSKRSRFDIANMQSPESEAWGLKVRYEVSAAYVAFYHTLILIPPFIFWGWWQSGHPDDMQNAAVPATAAIGMLSLFWCTNGILTRASRT